MTRITIDERVAREIKAAQGTFELCDVQGNVIGVACADGTEFPAVNDPCLPSPEEMKKIMSGPMYTFEQVLKGLEG